MEENPKDHSFDENEDIIEKQKKKEKQKEARVLEIESTYIANSKSLSKTTLSSL